VHQVIKRKITIALEELSIKINIADRFYPLVVTSQQEESVRKAAKLINDKLKHLQMEFAVKDKQDMLAMTLLELTTELMDIKHQQLGDENSVKTQLQQTAQLLSHISL
jgi:cell division protein ZapA (FtsZ GTPase activity inhibitor)